MNKSRLRRSRCIVALLSTFVLAACNNTPATSSQLNPAVDYLLTSAANDFHTHRPPDPARFRDVRSGYVNTSAGPTHYRLCGEFLPAQAQGKAEWLPFATIKTSGYEQWLGAQAAGFCKDSSVTWDKGDLSAALQSRLDSLQ